MNNDPDASHTLYCLLVKQLPIGLFRKDTEGRYVLVNDQYCKLRNKREGEILGKTAGELAASERENPHETALLNDDEHHHAGIMRTGKSIEVEERYSLSNGQDLYLHVIKSPAFDADGRIVGSQGFLIDHTLRKRVELELNRERSLMQALMNNSDDCIYFKDLESRFILCSSKLVRLFGLQNAAEATGKRDSDFFGKHAQEAFEDEQEIIRTGKPILDKVEKETWQDGRITWALTDKMPLYNDAGKIVGTFGISKDITDMKRAEAKLNEVHAQLVDASRLAGMSEVATSVLHNVGNVLNSINVSTSLIEDKMQKSKVSNLPKAAALLQAHKNDAGNFFANDPKGKQLPDYLANLAAHLAQEQEEILNEVKTLVNNVIHIKEIVSRQQNYAKMFGVVEKLPVVALVEDALQLNSGSMSRHNINVVRDYAEVPSISTEKHKVLQILVNLICNAKNACDDSGHNGKQITLRIAHGNGLVKISVSDNGIGIPPENLTRIFSHGFTTRKDGHGFGLHNGALAAKEIGGSLTAFSEGPGRGAIFTLELPV